MNKLELTILKENYQELSSRLYNVNKYLEEFQKVISINCQLKEEVKLNDEQLKIFKDLKESYLTPYYMPYDKNSIENNLKKISLVIETIEEKRK